MKKLLLIALNLALLISACTTAVIEDTDPNTLPPIQGVIRYVPEIQGVMTNYCTTCHSGPAASTGVNLTSYQNVRFYTESGNLVERVNSTTNPMPPSGLMPAIERQRIAKWVEDGFPQN
ncbi:MAG: hypothetical protein HEP71_29155 [Roseivirga sp.]|nr:hypothetical protein [Roseivirga sp.]